MMLCGRISAAGWKLSAIVLLSCFFLPGSLAAQAPPPSPVAEENAPPNLPPEALNKLLAPIALYPDALVALMLPAATVPSDLVLAARYLSSNGDPAQIANQSWDDSVKSLVRYPDVVKWMDQNLEWTTQVGDAFLTQPADVMNAIQQLRAQAIAAGNLVDCPEQRIVKEESCIRIVPAEPDVIYVPRYDPEVVYVEPYEPYEPYFAPALTFGIGFAVGSWLNYDCDWPRRRVCVGDWNPRWRDDWNSGWRGNWGGNRRGDYAVVSINTDTARVWQPSASIQRQRWQRQRASDVNAFGLNARGGDPGNGGRRFATVARPSLPNFDSQAGGGNRRGGRRSDLNNSNLARSLPGDIRDPGALAGSQSIQGEQLNRGNGNREGRGRGRERGDLAGNLPGGIRDPGTLPGSQSIQEEQLNRGNGNREGRGREQSDLARNLPGGTRDPGALAGSQSIQGEQWNRGNSNREGKGKGRGQSDSQSRAMARQQAEPPSVGGNAGKAENFKGRKWRADSASVESRKSSPSVSGQSSRSKHSGSVRSKANDSSQKFKAGRSKSPQSGNTARSFSEANKHAQAGNRPKGGSQRHVAAAPQQGKAQSAGGGKKGGGGGQKGGKGKDKGRG